MREVAGSNPAGSTKLRLSRNGPPHGIGVPWPKYLVWAVIGCPDTLCAGSSMEERAYNGKDYGSIPYQCSITKLKPL